MNDRGESKKKELLQAVQGHLEKMSDQNFDGILSISVKKGYFGPVRGFPRRTKSYFNPREAEKGSKKRVLMED